MDKFTEYTYRRDKMTVFARVKFIETNEGFGSGDHLLEDFVPDDIDNFIEPLNVWVEGKDDDWIERYCCTVASKNLDSNSRKLIGKGAYVGEPFWFERFDNNLIASTLHNYVEKYPVPTDGILFDWLRPKLIHEDITFDSDELRFDVN